VREIVPSKERETRERVIRVRVAEWVRRERGGA